MPSAPPIDATVRPARPADLATVDALLDRAFGPGRHAKTAYRIRELAGEDDSLAFTAWHDGRLVGAIAFAPITVAGTSARLLGPLAVEPMLAGRGVGLALLRHGVAAAGKAGHRLIVLVGDPVYYGRVGFAPVPPGRIVFPGPVDPGRLLWLSLAEDALDGLSGPLLPDTA